MFAIAMRVSLTPTERSDLEQLLRATSTPSGIARRAVEAALPSRRRARAGGCPARGPAGPPPHAGRRSAHPPSDAAHRAADAADTLDGAAPRRPPRRESVDGA